MSEDIATPVDGQSAADRRGERRRALQAERERQAHRNRRPVLPIPGASPPVAPARPPAAAEPVPEPVAEPAPDVDSAGPESAAVAPTELVTPEASPPEPADAEPVAQAAPPEAVSVEPAAAGPAEAGAPEPVAPEAVAPEAASAESVDAEAPEALPPEAVSADPADEPEAGALPPEAVPAASVEPESAAPAEPVLEPGPDLPRRSERAPLMGGGTSGPVTPFAPVEPPAFADSGWSAFTPVIPPEPLQFDDEPAPWERPQSWTMPSPAEGGGRSWMDTRPQPTEPAPPVEPAVPDAVPEPAAALFVPVVPETKTNRLEHLGDDEWLSHLRGDDEPPAADVFTPRRGATALEEQDVRPLTPPDGWSPGGWIEDVPGDQASLEDGPVVTGADEVPVGEVPVGEVPVGEVPVDEVPNDDGPVEGVRVDEVPVDEVQPEDVLVDEVQPEDVLVDEVQAEDVLVDGVQAEDAPVDEAASDQRGIVEDRDEPPVDEPVEHAPATPGSPAPTPLAGLERQPDPGLSPSELAGRLGFARPSSQRLSEMPARRPEPPDDEEPVRGTLEPVLRHSTERARYPTGTAPAIRPPVLPSPGAGVTPPAPRLITWEQALAQDVLPADGRRGGGGRTSKPRHESGGVGEYRPKTAPDRTLTLLVVVMLLLLAGLVAVAVWVFWPFSGAAGGTAPAGAGVVAQRSVGGP